MRVSNETLDPAWTYETAGSAIENNIYEGVVWFNKDRTDDFVGVLATDWEVNEVGDAWTFNIRDGVTFHEGGTLEPSDIAYSVHRALLQDRIDGPHWMTLEAFFGLYTIEDLAIEIAGVESFDEVPEAALVETCEMVKAAVVADNDAGTVTYNLNMATPWFLAMLSNSFLGATYDKEWMVENGAWDGDCATWVQWHDPAAEDTILFNEANGTGPYMLDHWTPGEETRPGGQRELLAHERADLGRRPQRRTPASSAWCSRTSTSGAPAWPCSRPATPTISMRRPSTARSLSPTTWSSLPGRWHLRGGQRRGLYPGLPRPAAGGHDPGPVQLEHQRRGWQPLCRQRRAGRQRHPARLFPGPACPQGVQLLLRL